MIPPLADIHPNDGDRVVPDQISVAVTAASLEYDDGASQVFESNGNTTYVEAGRPTRGEWSIDDDGHFCSFWPPSYRASYELAAARFEAPFAARLLGSRVRDPDAWDYGFDLARDHQRKLLGWSSVVSGVHKA